MTNSFTSPDWCPKLKSSQKVFITGATGGIGRALVKLLLNSEDCLIGAHGHTKKLDWGNDRIIPIYSDFTG